MVSRDFVQLLNSLSIDPILASSFKEDADAVFATSFLSVEEKGLLTSGDPEKIHEALSSADEAWGARALQSGGASLLSKPKISS